MAAPRSSCSRFRALAALVALSAASLPSTAGAADEPAGRKYALLVGVSEYKSSAELRSLPGAENDVTHLRQALLNGGYKADDITLLTCRGGTRPTGENIRAALKSLADRCKPEDTVVLAFAGHGIQLKDKDSEPSFCPYDAVWDNAETLIPLLKVFEEVGRCPAKQKLLLVDACRVDPRAEVEGAEDKKKAVANGIKLTVPRDSNFVALFSCSEGQVAWEDSRLRHGVFFHYTILGLAGDAAEKDGVVDVDGLVKYVRKNTKEHVKKEFDAEQEPYMYSGSGLFPILRLSASTEVQKLMQAALIAEGKGDGGAAQKAYTQVIELDKKNAEAYYRRGLLLKDEARDVEDDKAKQTEKYQAAARDFDRALRYKPEMVDAYLARADVNYRQDDLQAALRDYEAALELDEGGAEVLTARAYVYYWLEQPDKAMADIEQAIKLNPEYARAYYVRGVTRLGANQADEGMTDLDKAIAMDPHNLKYRDYRLSVVVQQGDAERVAKEEARIEQLATYVPRSDLYAQQTILYQQANIGDFYQTRGDSQRAEKAFQRANNRAEFVGNGLQQQNAKVEWFDKLNKVQNRPGQPSTNTPPPNLGAILSDPNFGKALNAFLAPKKQTPAPTNTGNPFAKPNNTPNTLFPNNTPFPKTNNTPFPKTNNAPPPKNNNTLFPNNIPFPKTNNTPPPKTNNIPFPKTNNTPPPKNNTPPPKKR